MTREVIISLETGTLSNEHNLSFLNEFNTASHLSF